MPSSKAKSGARGAERSAVTLRADCLSGILDNDQLVALCDFHDGSHVCHLAK